jgi:hypothetical protein
MDKTPTTVKADTPKVEFPKMNMPKLDLDAVVALQRANIETFLAAQRILFDLAQTVAKRQSELFKDYMGKAEVAVKGGFDAKKQPTTYVDDAKAVIERAVADAKETLDLGLKAQSEVVDLFMKRATANFDHVKALAA